MAQSTMIPEEHVLGCKDNSGGGGGGGGGDGDDPTSGGVSGGNNNNRSSKNANNKPKKVPQRGLGVAQLEKLISEEQRKKEAANNYLVPGNFVSSPINPVSCFPLPNVSSHGHGDWLRMLMGTGEYNLDAEKVNNRGDNLGFGLIRPQRLYYPVQPPSSSLSMVNAPSGILPSSSVINPQMEPPSNQIFRVGNGYSSTFPDGDKTTGTKRPYPFTLESSSIPSFSSSHRSLFSDPKLRTDDLALRNERYAPYIESRNTYVREGPSSLKRTASEEEEVIRDHESTRLDGDFLTLAPPNVSSQPLILKAKNLSDHRGLRLHDFKSTSQEHEKGDVNWLRQSGSIGKQPFSLFPVMSDSDVRNDNSGKGKEDEEIDLTLKL